MHMRNGCRTRLVLEEWRRRYWLDDSTLPVLLLRLRRAVTMEIDLEQPRFGLMVGRLSHPKASIGPIRSAGASRLNSAHKAQDKTVHLETQQIGMAF